MFKTLFQNQPINGNSVFIQSVFLIALLVLGKADPMAIVFAYVLETIIIGVIHVVKLYYVIENNQPSKKIAKLENYFFIPFFIVHYGFFVSIQSVFIYIAFAIADTRFSTSLSISNFIDIFNLQGFKLVALSIIVSNLVSFYFSFLKTKKYENQNLETYMLKPYLRIFVQQFLAIIPFVFLYVTDSVGIIAAILLILMRTILDYYFITVAKNPEKIKKIALRILDKNKPEELPNIEKSLITFFEE